MVVWVFLLCSFSHYPFWFSYNIFYTPFCYFSNFVFCLYSLSLPYIVFLPLPHLTSGCGLNVDNKYPTICLNDCIDIFNKESGTSLAHLPSERMLALTLNKLEMYLALYETYGFPAIEQVYYQHWMHSWVVDFTAEFCVPFFLLLLPKCMWVIKQGRHWIKLGGYFVDVPFK